MFSVMKVVKHYRMCGVLHTDTNRPNILCIRHSSFRLNQRLNAGFKIGFACPQSSRLLMMPKSKRFCKSISAIEITCKIATLIRYNDEDNGEISPSVREAGSHADCTKNTAGKKFIELLYAGFLERTKKTFFNFGKGLASTWAITHLPSFGTAATNLWKRMENKT